MTIRLPNGRVLAVLLILWIGSAVTVWAVHQVQHATRDCSGRPFSYERYALPQHPEVVQRFNTWLAAHPGCAASDH